MLSNITFNSQKHPGDRQSSLNRGENNYHELDSQIAFSDEIDSSAQSTSKLEAEIAALRKENATLQQEISLKRVLRLAHDACMDVQRTVGGWILKMGDKARKFRRLADIWDLLSVDEFILSEIFPPEKLVAIDLIQPPKRRKKPESLEKTTFPLMRPEDVIRNRTMLLVKSG